MAISSTRNVRSWSERCRLWVLLCITVIASDSIVYGVQQLYVSIVPSPADPAMVTHRDDPASGVAHVFCAQLGGSVTARFKRMLRRLNPAREIESSPPRCDRCGEFIEREDAVRLARR